MEGIQGSVLSKRKGNKTLQKPISRCKCLANCMSILNAQCVHRFKLAMMRIVSFLDMDTDGQSRGVSSFINQQRILNQ